MRRLVVPLLALVALALSVPSAGAIELRNEDARAHTVRVSSRSMTRNVHLPPHSASLVVCVKTCSFHLYGGHVRASGDDVVTIQEKKLVRRAVVKAQR